MAAVLAAIGSGLNRNSSCTKVLDVGKKLRYLSGSSQNWLVLRACADAAFSQHQPNNFATPTAGHSSATNSYLFVPAGLRKLSFASPSAEENDMRLRHILFLVPLLFLASCNQLCVPVPKCGDFTFTGNKVDTPDNNGLDMNLRFDFHPASCGSGCTCNPVCYLQIVRTVDLEALVYIYPSAEKQDRANAEGWYIDRIEGRIWGYYGRNNDGSFAGNLTPGSDTTPTTLFDGPRRPEAEPWIQIWWQAVSVPVCIQAGSGCENKLLGYYFWSWTVNNAGVVNGPIDAVAWKSLDAEIPSAVAGWNAQAPGLGKNTFPAFSPLAP